MAQKSREDLSHSELDRDDADAEKQVYSTRVKPFQQTPDQATISNQGIVDESNNTPTSQQLEGWRLYVVQSALSIALFLGALDSSIVATSLLTIGRDFNNFVQLQWIVLAYILTELGFAFIFARVSDIIGRKAASITAVVILTASSLACGLSQNLTQLIVFRAFQGVGGSGVYTLPFTVLPEITPPHKFATLSGFTSLTFICSSILGPTLGGVITTHSTWRWIFFINVPIGVFVIALILIAWPTNQLPRAGQLKWRELDVIGFLLSFATLVLLIFALQEAGTQTYAWSSALIVTCLVVSGVSAVSLIFWIPYLSSGNRMFVPLFPARVLSHRVLAANAIVTTLVGYILFTLLVGLPQRFQLVNGASPQAAGINLLPLLGATAFSSGIGAIISSAKNRSFYTIVAGSAIAIIGIGLLSSVPASTNIPKVIYGYEVIVGLGTGCTVVSTILMIKLNARDEDAASAQGIQAQARLVGGNIGLALATIILNVHLDKDLKGILTPAQISDVRRSLNAAQQLSPTQLAALADSFARSFRTQMQVCVGISGLSLVFAIMTWQRHPPSFQEMGKSVRNRK